MSNLSAYDLVIIGGGPAGLAAGIYGARAKLKTLILEKATVGGQAYTTRELINYPGFKDTTGPDLMEAMENHAKEFGTEIIKDEVVAVELDSDIKKIKTKGGNQYTAKAVIVAAGTKPRLLNIPGEKEFRGMGVSYCATCDAEFYEDLDVVVVGNGDAAIEEAMYITKFARKVYIIVIHDEGIVDCNKVSAQKAFKNEKIEFIWNSVLTEIKGDDEVTAVSIKNLKTGQVTDLKTDGVFIYIGMIPETKFLENQVETDEKGFIITNAKMETSLEGVYAVGDARAKYLRQVVTAVNDGAIAAVAAEKYLEEKTKFEENIINEDRFVLLAFWEPTKDESISLVSELEQLVDEIKEKVKLVKIDFSRNKEIAKKYNISTAPSILLLKKGEVYKDLSTFKDIKNLKAEILQQINE